MPQNIVHKPVAEVMTPYLISGSPYMTLAEAEEQMKKNHIRRLPIVDQDNRLVGIITSRDVVAAAPAAALHARTPEERVRALATVTVGAVMAQKPFSVFQTDTIARAAEIMLDQKIGGIPVIDVNDKVVGIITESDIFRAIVRQWRDDNLILSGAHRA